MFLTQSMKIIQYTKGPVSGPLFRHGGRRVFNFFVTDPPYRKPHRGRRRSSFLNDLIFIRNPVLKEQSHLKTRPDGIVIRCYFYHQKIPVRIMVPEACYEPGYTLFPPLPEF